VARWSDPKVEQIAVCRYGINYAGNVGGVVIVYIRKIIVSYVGL
jgi:hypothetical protein